MVILSKTIDDLTIDQLANKLLESYRIAAEMTLNGFKGIPYEEQQDSLGKALQELGDIARSNHKLKKEVKRCQEAAKNFSIEEQPCNDQVKDLHKYYINNNCMHKPCHKCFNNSTTTIEFPCGHYLCANCITQTYSNAISYKCLMPNCYCIFSDEFFKSMGIEAKKLVNRKDNCIICGNNKANNKGSCEHKLCRKCFKEYGEYITNGEVVVIAKREERKDKYEEIPCPQSGCEKSFSQTNLLKLYDELEKQSIVSNAYDVFNALTPVSYKHLTLPTICSV
eukprot:TRINITY_DN11710_c0_g1_i2.p1 TRINITY_DN11710_c0_g1~~TRINITY_DN11710_c0_g1_i2.p1  ORF type:complete len:280 (-),score=57.03 TRINITY_DN11710_c0_g1_i2:41-880(-)